MTKNGNVRFDPARFWGVDLHVHTPASSDVNEQTYGATTPEEIVAAAIEAGLDAIAITDHNTASWCDHVSNAAKGTTLIVLPGVEISTSEGHLLGIWEEGTDTQDILDVLVELGIKTKDHGKLDISANVGFLDAAQFISDSGGVAIAAHGDGEKGVLSLTVAAHLKKILESEHLSAVEILDAESKVAVENKAGVDVVIACTMGSDTTEEGSRSHVLAGIGRRRTWVKASRPDLRGLQHALGDPKLGIRLTQPEDPEHARITSVSVSGGFLDGEQISFSPDLSCLLGGTGTGKSLVLELIRFALDQQTPETDFPAVREEVDRRLEGALRTDSTVEVTVVRGADSTIKIRRTFDETGSPPPEIVEGDPTAEVPIRAFSQGEIIEYAREPVGRMQLVDSGIDLTVIEGDLGDIKETLAVVSHRVCDLRTEISSIEESLNQLPEVKNRVRELSELFDARVVKAQAGWAKERSRFKRLKTLLDDAVVRPSTKARFAHGVAVPKNKDLYTQVSETLNKLDEAVNSSRESIDQAVDEAQAALDGVADDWERRYDVFADRLSTEIAKADVDGKNLKSLRKRLETLQAEKAELEESKVRLRKELKPSLLASIGEREELVDQMVALRLKRRRMRQARVRKLNKAMGGTVKITVAAEIDDDEFLRELTALAKGSHIQTSYLVDISMSALPIKLVTSYLGSDAESVAGATGVPRNRIETLFEHIRHRGLEREFLALQSIEIADGLKIKFRKPETNNYADIEDLAHGQKCTAILVIALAEGSEPLIIDQPEDALHPPWIEEYLVERLRKLRGERQYIFATRSPGLVVSADAEMLITLSSRADKGQVEAAGSLERHEMNKLALYHLEGGPIPFKRRADKLSQTL